MKGSNPFRGTGKLRSLVMATVVFTEHEWLTSKSMSAVNNITTAIREPSERQLRFITTGTWRFMHPHYANHETICESIEEGEESTPPLYTQGWQDIFDALLKSKEQNLPAIGADIYRDVVGNPFQPVPKWCNRVMQKGRIPSWVFNKPTVITQEITNLAVISYNARGQTRCTQCKGRGIEHEVSIPLVGTGETQKVRPTKETPCTYCEGRGYVCNGLLFNERLAVLSDYLEDIAFPHLDMIEHLRAPGYHVRGCWVLDLLLGHL